MKHLLITFSLLCLIGCATSGGGQRTTQSSTTTPVQTNAPPTSTNRPATDTIPAPFDSTTTPVRINRPDLEISAGDFSIQPTQLIIGQPVIFKAKVHNNGTAPSGEFKIGFYDDGHLIGNPLTVSNLNPNDSIIAQDTWISNSEHTSRLEVRADITNQVVERQEDNNIFYIYRIIKPLTDTHTPPPPPTQTINVTMRYDEFKNTTILSTNNFYSQSDRLADFEFETHYSFTGRYQNTPPANTGRATLGVVCDAKFRFAIRSGQSLIFIIDGVSYPLSSATGSIGTRELIGDAYIEAASYVLNQTFINALYKGQNVKARIYGDGLPGTYDMIFNNSNLTTFRQWVTICFGPPR